MVRKMCAVLCFAILVAACGGSSSSTKSSSSTPSWKQDGGLGSASRPIQMGIGRISLFMYAYKVPDILAKEGIHLDLVDMPNTPQRLQALLGGNLDVTFAGWVDTIKLASQGAKIVALSDVARKGAEMVAGTNSGINGPGDWKGKTVGVSKGSMQEMVALYELKKVNLAPSSVNLLQVGFADMPVALQKKDIDAFVGTEPYNAIAVSAGFGRSMGPYYNDVPWGDLNANMVAPSDLVASNPELCQKLVDAMTEATKQGNANPTASMQSAVTDFKVPATAVNLVFSNVTWTTDLDWKKIQGFIDAEYDLKYITTKPKIDQFVSSKFAKVVDK